MSHERLIDWHAHLFPPQLVKALSARTAPPIVEERDGRVFLQSRPGGEPISTSPSLLSVERRIAELDAARVDAQILSVAGLMGVDSVDDDSVHTLTAATNAGLASIVADNPDRFGGFASLPLRDVARAADVLEQAVRDQGLLGAILPTTAFADLSTAERFRPLIERAAALSATLFIHPGTLPGALAAPAPQTQLDRLRQSTTGIQNGITDAAVTFELSDYLDGLEAATILVANVGGNLAHLAGRWAHTEERLGIEPHWDGKLRRIHVDTSSLGERAIRYAADIFGADRLRFGTDSPIYPLAEPAAAARRLGIGFTPSASGPLAWAA